MSDVVLSYRGRLIREADVVFLREFIAQHSEYARVWEVAHRRSAFRQQQTLTLVRRGT